MRKTGPQPIPAAARPHLTARPSWRCRACGAPWPCSPARLALRREYADAPLALTIYLGMLLCDAVADLGRLHPDGGGPPPGELYDRFIGWTRPQPPSLYT